MSTLSVPATEAPPAQQATARPARLFFADHLRAALAILVVVHHVALVYGASSPFYYAEPPFNDPQAFKDLLLFVLFNQAWFMGAFFFLAGYFTPGSFDRKSVGAFLRTRLVRLGIPLLLFILVLNPISELGYYLMPAELTGITTSPSLQEWPDRIGLGPLWFVAMLLIFNFGYAAWRWLTRNRPAGTPRRAAPGYVMIVLFTLGLAVASFLFRMIVPLGEAVSVFVDFLSFPTLAYLPQYLGLFVVGIIAARRDWLRNIPDTMGIVGFVAAALAAIILFPLAFSGELFSLELGEALDNAMGNGHWQSAAYVLWDSIFAVGLMLGFITLFRRFLNQQSRLGAFLAQHSYAVYVLHIPIIVFLAYALRNVELATLPKFGLASLIIVPVCFAAAFIVRKLPLMSRVF